MPRFFVPISPSLGSHIYLCLFDSASVILKLRA